MKILVFDDNPIHRAAAEAQLKDHNLTVVGTYDEAQALLLPQIDQKKVTRILKDQFGDFNPYDQSEDAEKRDDYFAAKAIAVVQETRYPDFDVVLTDLLVPASGQQQGRSGEAFIGKEMPVGIFIALLAAVKGGAKYVAVLTDSNHHAHPASACFDPFNQSGIKPTPFTVERSAVIICNNTNWVAKYDPSNLSKELSYEEYCGRTDVVSAKNWRALLDYLLSA